MLIEHLLLLGMGTDLRDVVEQDSSSICSSSTEKTRNSRTSAV